jgi:predicted flap endonuclease-1-like 5' DNA nuclease
MRRRSCANIPPKMRASAKIGGTACSNLARTKGWKKDVMSFVTFIIYLVVLAAGCAGSWKGALYLNNRRRGPQHEDPRDQEIRELAAALSISRKSVDAHGLEKKQLEKDIWELKENLRKTGDAFSNMQQKFNATKETLSREIEGKSNFDEEVIQLRREKDDALTRIEELEVQARAAQNGGMVAGLDMLDEDEHALASAHQESNDLRAEVSKWKHHCSIMGETNKTLRAQVAELTKGNQAAKQLEAVSAHDDVVADEFPAETSALADPQSTAAGEANRGTAASPAEATDEPTDSVATLSQEAIDASAEPADNADDSEELQRDDLQSIRGVGSKLEQKLNLLGIFSYKEIMLLESEDFERANLVIPNLQNRIERDAWQDQARALHLEKYNEVI